MQLLKYLSAVLSVILFANLCAAVDPIKKSAVESDTSFGKLQLSGGDVYRGEFGKTTDASGSLVWRCPSFVSDLIVPWDAVDGIVQPLKNRSKGEAVTETPFIVEMQNGEALTGKITDMSDTFVDVDSELVGKKRIPIGFVRSILRTSGTTESESGELKLSDWKQIEPKIKNVGRGNWFDGLGSYDTETAGTIISQSVLFPDLAAIDVNVSWQSTTPNWLVQIGEPRKLELHVRRLENRNTLSITVLVEDETTADIATAQLPLDGSNALSLRVLCDSVRGRLVVMQNGIAIAQLRLNKSLRLTGRQTVLFTNNVAGRLSLRSLKIYRSIFSSPVLLTKGKEPTDIGNIKSPETLLQNGQTFVGQPIGFDTATRTFGFSTTAEILGRVSLEQVDRIEFPSNTDDASKAPAEKLFYVQLWSGARYVGQAVSIQSNQLLLSLKQSQAKVQIPLEDVMSVGQNGLAKPEYATSETSMRFVSPWVVSYGKIVAMNAADSTPSKLDFRTLNWKPVHALLPVAIAAGVTGTIEPISTNAKADKPVKPKVSADFGRPLEKDEPSLFLKSGDCFAAEIKSVIDGQMVFESSLFSTNKIDVDLVRGVRKLAYTGTETMEKGSRKRLLTLPRSQRSNPPTHLVVSREGDAIRGHLQSMDVDELTLQVRGEDRKIQMKNIAEIIWLQDAPEIVPPGKNAPAVAEKSDTKAVRGDSEKVDLNCQALDYSGTRISLVPERVEGNILYGQHPQLGAAHVDLSKISKLVLGDAIADDAKRNRFGKWTLENAIDPKFVNDLDSPDSEGGNAADSPHARMIGKAAPDFELKKLDGTLLKLSDLKGRIVVLDFWATWCGPCVASLPKITELGQEYKGAEVDVIAVNIEQTSAEVRALLDRLKISPVVVLDSDGAAARAYLAQAIPQTVIIDRDGNVKQVIVGGGGTTEAKIRDSLDGMLNLKL